MDNARIAWFNAAIQFGSMLLQYPVGRLSDRGDRRYVLLAVLGGTIALAILVAMFARGAYALVLVLATLYGGLSFTIYPVCLAHAADRVEARHLVSISSGLLMAWALGATVGPLLASLALQLLGPAGLFLFVAATCALFLAFVVWRMTRRPADSAGPALSA